VEVYFTYPASLGALLSNNYKQINHVEHNRIKNPNWQEATSGLFTSVAKDLNLVQQRWNLTSGHGGNKPWTAGMQIQWADHLAMGSLFLKLEPFKHGEHHITYHL